MVRRDAEAITEIVLKALAIANRRGVLSLGWGGLSRGDLPDSVIQIDDAPHDWLFPKMAAVVHHGGAGTTAAGLRAGVPSVVIPFFGDQWFWGWRVAELGAGPAPIPRRKLTAGLLARAIEFATTDRHVRERAAGLGRLIRAERGGRKRGKTARRVPYPRSTRDLRRSSVESIPYSTTYSLAGGAIAESCCFESCPRLRGSNRFRANGRPADSRRLLEDVFDGYRPLIGDNVIPNATARYNAILWAVPSPFPYSLLV